MRKLACLAVIVIFSGCAAKRTPEPPNPCRDGLSYRDGLCHCGTEGLTPDESAQWDCMDNAHYMCLKTDGCTKGDHLYPTWGHFADTLAVGDMIIPAMPRNAKGYKLVLFAENKYAWRCSEHDCACGKGTIHAKNHDICQNESFKASPETDCGDEKCGIDHGVCRDGKCWCAETWQGPEPSKYRCEEHPVYGLDLLEEEICAKHPEVCEYIRSQPSDQLDYLCKAEEGCRCGSDTCKAGSICRQDKCYCGDIDISQYENHQDYECKLEPPEEYDYETAIPHHAMVCAADNGCKCGEHRIVKGAECIDGKQVCHGAQIDWVDESVISQYACDVEHPMIVCSNPQGCKCGKDTCLQGASCIDGECACGNQFRLNDDVALHRDQYICYNGQYICNHPEGCDCDKEKCVEGSTCDNARCSCGEYTNTTVERFGRFECIHEPGGHFGDDLSELYCGHKTGCKAFYKDRYDNDSNTEETEAACTEGDFYSDFDGCEKFSIMDNVYSFIDDDDIKIGNRRYHFYERLRPDYLTMSICEDCDQFSVYESHDSGTCRDVFQFHVCKVNGGCMHHNKYHEFGTALDASDATIYAGFPDKTYATPQSGSAVAVCNHIYPLGVLNTFLRNGIITEIRDPWICDDDTCACGSETCRMGDLCQSGRCSPYQGCSTKTKADAVVYYCHGANQKPLPRPNDSDNYHCLTKEQSQRSSRFKDIIDGDEIELRHWYCEGKQCACGSQFCPKGSYCEDGVCFCGEKPLEEGYLCENHRPVCNSRTCSCGGEALREGYRCQDERQLCITEDGCMCGSKKILFNEICDHGVAVCASDSSHTGCRCGDRALPQGYRCHEQKLICNEEACACGEGTCGLGDICDNGTCLCGNHLNKGCLCGADAVSNPDQYRCIDRQLVCWPDGLFQTDHYPAGIDDCACGNTSIPVGTICKGGKLCEDCDSPIAMRDKKDYFHKTCAFEDKKYKITYYYEADCYPGVDDEQEWRGEIYICEDGTTYYELDTIDPCECLKEFKTDGKNIQQEELSKHYCVITQHYVQDCSERIPTEIVEGWMPIDREDNANPCEKAEHNSMVVPDYDAQSCVCGNDRIPMGETENYFCDLLRWRCNRDEGCACGHAVCKKSQICLHAGECSR